ncbi:MAG: hypothetical protein ACKOS8_15500, partial [Gemmataceae bacterium]
MAHFYRFPNLVLPAPKKKQPSVIENQRCRARIQIGDGQLIRGERVNSKNQVVVMANSYFGTSVGLPRDHDQVFPDCCVSCLAHEAEKRFRFRAGTDSWFLAPLRWFRGPFVEANLCLSCHKKLFAVGLLKFAVLFGPLLAYVWFGVPLLNQHVPSHLAFWARFGGLLLVCSPYAIAEMLLPCGGMRIGV